MVFDYNNIEKDIYIFPSSLEGRNILYSPLRDVSLFINDSATTQIIDYYKNGVDPGSERVKKLLIDLNSKVCRYPEPKEKINITDKATFLLSNICNFACRYCFALHSRNTTILSREKIATVVDYVFSTPNKNKGFSFLGGGEPTVTWELLKWSVEYIRNKNNDNKYNVYIGITTNGSLLTKERVVWLNRNMNKVLLSFDILPDLQNKNRPLFNNNEPSFKMVDNALQLMLNEKVSCRIRSTITKDNVNKMMDMFHFVEERYKGINELHFEPVCNPDENDETFYNDFVSNFIEVYVEGLKKGIMVQNSISHGLFHLKDCYCAGEMCITPTGDIVSCHRHISKNDKKFELFHYGKVDNDCINFDNEKIKKIIAYRMNKSSDCNYCFAKWNCAGGCASVRANITEEQNKEYCAFIKKLLKALIEKTIIINS